MSSGISSATEFLRDAMQRHLARLYANLSIRCDEVVDPNLRWVPTLSCAVNHQVMLIEVSESPYPNIFRMRRAEMAEVQAPIAAYSACPEEAYVANQRDAADLGNHGFGLFTVNSAGEVTQKTPAIPIAQHIPESQFILDIGSLPATHKRRARESFELYKHNAPAGVASLAEHLEGAIVRAAADAAKKNWITRTQSRGNLASVLVTLQSLAQLRNSDTVIASSRSYIQRYRNAAHHIPKNKKQAFIKYRDCRHGFLDGLRQIREFRDAMRSAGLSGKL